MGERRGIRRQAREAALQALFMCDFHTYWNSDGIEFCFDCFNIPKSARVYATQLCHGVIENLARIDSRITCSSEHWSISRMAKVDRSILRIGVFEMFYLTDIPISVAIDEAVEIAKRFGSEESPMFVNGVLDRAASSLKGQIKVERIADAPPAEQVVELPVAVDELAAQKEETDDIV